MGLPPAKSAHCREPKRTIRQGQQMGRKEGFTVANRKLLSPSGYNLPMTTFVEKTMETHGLNVLPCGGNMSVTTVYMMLVL